MVNVTKANFLEQSNDLLKHLPTAAFVAIDEEMTGISLPGSGRPSKDDTPSQRYENIKTVPERYAVIQLGVALFHEHPDYQTKKKEAPSEEGSSSDVKSEAEYLVRRYNFYLFPPSSNDVTREVTMNPSSVAFLNEHNMNFDMWTKQGIPFVTTNVAQELMKKYQAKLEKQQQQQQQLGKSGKASPDPRRRKVELNRAEDINFHARTMASLREWIDAATVPPAAAAAETHNDDDTSEGSSFLLPPCNSFLRRALYETIEAEYPSLILERGGPSAPNQIRVLRLSPEQKRRREDRVRRENWEDLVVNQIGFWRVFRALSNACRGITEVNSIALADNANFAAESDSTNSSSDGIASSEPYTIPAKRAVPIVVHNGLMDLLFVMTHFHSHTLPSTYEEAKALVHDYFPQLYDTKILSSECSGASIRNDSTVLSGLYEKVVIQDEENNMSKVLHFVDQPSENSGSAADQIHEAAYDAYMTGAVYVSLCKRILNGYSKFPESWGGPQVGSLAHLSAPNDDKITRALFGRNKIYLMLTLYTIDLESPLSDPLSRGMSPSNTFRVEGIDPSVTTRDIVRCLSNLDNETRVNFEIVWVNDCTFMVAAQHVPDNVGGGRGAVQQPLLLNDNENWEEAPSSTLVRHGQLIREALVRRFQKETIITLKEHLEQLDKAQQEEEIQDVNTTYMKWWPAKVASSLLGVVGWASPAKRKVDHSDSERGAKRRRLNFRQ